MSLLLDAVQRAKHADAAKLDPALAPPLPTPVKRPRNFYWVLPPLGLALGAALAWYWPQPELVTEVTKAPAQQAPYRLGQRVVMPAPMPLPVEQSEVQIAKIDDAGQVKLAAAKPVPSAVPAAPEGEPDVDMTPLLAQQLVEAAQLYDLEGVAELKAESPGAEATQAEDDTLVDTAMTAEDQALLAAFEQAVAQVGQGGESVSDPEPMDTPDIDAIPKFGQLPWSVQKRVPDLVISAHIYATEPADRWLRANGRELQEGDEAAPGLVVDEIRPNEVVLDLDGTKFRIPALGSI